MNKKLNAWGQPILEKDFDETKGYWYFASNGKKEYVHPNLYKMIKFTQKHNIKPTDTPSEAVAKIKNNS